MPQDTPMTVVFVDSAAALGGAEKSLLVLLQHLTNRVRPVLVCNPGMMADAGKQIGVPVCIIPMPRLRRSLSAPAALARGSLAIARLLAQHKAALIVSNTMRASFYAALAAGRVPLVWYVRDVFKPGSYVRWIARHARLAIAVSRAAAAPLPKRLPTMVLPNSIDLSAFDGELRRLPNPRSQWGISPAAPLVGMVGSLRAWKGHADFIQAMARVHQALPQARFVIVGGDIFGVGSQYETELRRLAQQLQLQDALVFAGQREDIAAVMHTFDILVHCSIEPEAFGRVIIEAMAAGVPVVAYNQAGPAEIVRDGTSGILVPPGDSAALAEACRRLLVNPALAREMGRQGRLIVETQYDIELGARRFEDALIKVARGDSDAHWH